MSKPRLKLQVSHENHERKSIQQQSQNIIAGDKSGTKLTSNNKKDTKSKTNNADSHLSLIGQSTENGKEIIKDTGKQKELTKNKEKTYDQTKSEVKGTTKGKEAQNNEKMPKIPIKQSHINLAVSNINQPYLSTIDSINKSQQKVKTTIQELIKQYKDSSDDIFTNYGHNPQKQAEINNRLSRLQKQKQERARKLQKSYQLQELKRQLKQQKEKQKVEKKINQIKTKIKARAESKLQQIQRSATQRQRNQLQYLQHYQQYRGKQFRFQKYQSQQAQRLKQEQLQLKLKLKMIHNRYSPIDHASLNDFQQEYQQHRWGQFEDDEKKREFQIRVIEEQNNKLRRKLWRGKCHKTVEMQIQHQKQKKKDRKKVQDKRKDYATSVKTSMMPKSVRESSMSRVIASIQNQIVEKQQKNQGDAVSQSHSENEPKSQSKQKKVITYRYFQGKNQGPFIEKRKVPLNHSEKLQKGNQYLQHLHNLPKKLPSTVEPTASGEPSPPPKAKIVKIVKQSNPYYIDPPRDFGGLGIPNKETFNYNLAKLDKVDKSIGLQEKVIKFGSYSGVLELQRRQNAYTKNVAKNVARKLDMLSDL